MKALVSFIFSLVLLVGSISNSFADADKPVEYDVGIETHHQSIDQACLDGNDGFCLLLETEVIPSIQWQKHIAETPPSILSHRFANYLIRAPPFHS